MIPADRLEEIGYIIKPHGVRGEMSAFIEEPERLPDDAGFFFFNIEGLMVPFAIEKMRMRGSQGALITLEGIESDTEAAAFSGKALFFLKDELVEYEDEEEDGEEGGFYLKDIIGFTATRGEELLGTVTDYNDSTANVLLVITTPAGAELLIPVADEFIAGIDTESKTIDFDVPDGLLQI